MTLDPRDVCEAWCHQRDYVCMIEEIGGRPIKPGESFGAAFIVGFFDSLDEMHDVYDRYAAHNRLDVALDGSGWQLAQATVSVHGEPRPRAIFVVSPIGPEGQSSGEPVLRK